MSVTVWLLFHEGYNEASVEGVYESREAARRAAASSARADAKLLSDEEYERHAQLFGFGRDDSWGDYFVEAFEVRQ